MLLLLSLRFSHSPLIDEDDEEEEAKEPMLNEAFGKNFHSPALHCDSQVVISYCWGTVFADRRVAVWYSSSAPTTTEILFEISICQHLNPVLLQQSMFAIAALSS